MEPTSKITPYEDVYGKKNVDEEFDRFPDVCEDETDSEDDDTNGMEDHSNARIFQRFSTPRNQNSFFGRFTTPARSRDSVDISNDLFVRMGTGKTTSLHAIMRESGTSRMKISFYAENESLTFTHHADHNNTPTSTHGPGYAQYRISPSANPRRSVAATPNKKLTARNKYGLFASPASRIDHANTAGDGMDDLLRDGSLTKLDDSFPTLEEDDDQGSVFPATKRTLNFGPPSVKSSGRKILSG